MLLEMTTLGTLLGSMIVFVILGEPLRILIGRFSTLFKNLDFIEASVLDFYLGGFVLYVFALFPLQLLSVPIIAALFSLSLVVIVVYRWKIRRVEHNVQEAIEEKKWRTIDQSIVLGLFLFLLVLQVLPLTPLSYGSIHDVSLHSLLAQVIVENHYLPGTLAPYSAEGVVYPEASHVVFAATAELTGWLVPRAIFYMTQLSIALTVFAAYFFARRILPDRTFYLGMSFVFAFVSAWPLFITWGANPFVLGFPLLLICSGILLQMVLDSNKSDYKEFVIIGLLFGYLGAIIVSFLQTLLMMSLIWAFFLIFWRPSKRRFVLSLILVFSISIIPMTPFIYRFISYYQYPGHNIGLPSDFSSYSPIQQLIWQGLQWAIENLAPYALLRNEMIAVCILSPILFFAIDKQRRLTRPFLAALLILVASLILSLVSYLLPSSMTVVSWGHQGIIMAVTLSLLVALFGYHLFAFVSRMGSRIFAKTKRKSEVFFVVTILLISATYAPFVYSRIVLDPWTLKGAYSMFAVTWPQDDVLMHWMKENLTNNAVILVNPYEAGLFIPSISNKKTIFTTTGSQLSLGYQKLFNSLCNDTLNSTSYDIMRRFSVTHVYVGSAASYSWVKDYKWDKNLFLGNPNFRLVKRVGQACLFQVLYKDPSLVFQDDFQHEHWYDFGWDTGYDGNGLGNVTISDGIANDSEKSLQISAQAVYTASVWKYEGFVSRTIFVKNNSNVQLSFNFNLSSGFDGKDTFAGIVSNIYGNQSVAITTGGSAFAGYAHSIFLQNKTGHWIGNLTDLWVSHFSSPMPSRVKLQFVNIDFDGIENVVGIDNVNMTSNLKSEVG